MEFPMSYFQKDHPQLPLFLPINPALAPTVTTTTIEATSLTSPSMQLQVNPIDLNQFNSLKDKVLSYHPLARLMILMIK